MMNNKLNSTNWVLIAKYLSGDTNASETKHIEDWIKSGKENRKIFEEAKKNWTLLGSFSDIENIDKNNAWKTLKSRLLKDDLLAIDYQNRKKALRYFLRIAAIVVVSLGLVFGVYQAGFIRLNQKVAFTGAKDYGKNVTLPDGSLVFLNTNTKIFYLNKFKNGIREIYLKRGEAFFQVVHNPDTPFIVKTDEAEIKVLGTSFNVNLNTLKEGIEVFVETGSVQLKRKNTEDIKILIDKGSIGVLSNGKLSKSKNTDQNYMAWKTRYLVFKEERLEKVVHTLNRVYNVQITLTNRNTGNCKLTSTFDNQSIDAVIEVLSTTFQLKVDRKESGIILVGDSCHTPD